MKKYILPLIFIIVLTYSCNKDSEPPKPTGRGSVVSTTNLGTYNKIMLQAGLSSIAGNYINQIDFNYNVDAVKVVYNTINTKGEEAIASGLLLIPKGATTSLPLLSYQHGTILKKLDVPSRKGGEFEAGLITATIGYVTSIPDYLGMGDSEGLHPYMHAETEASATIDMLRAVKTICNDMGVQLNDQLFLIGYSQGGHSTMAALKKIEESHSTEFTVTACAPMAGAYDLSGIQMDYMLKDTYYPAPGYLPYLIYGYNYAYNLYPGLDTIFVAPYNTQFPNYFNNNNEYELGTVNALWPQTRIPSEVLNPNVVKALKEDPDYPIVVALRDNNLYDWKPVSPIRLCHCDGDMHVPYEHSEKAYNSFIAKGATDVQLINPLPGADHSDCVLPSMVYAITWFNSLKN